MTGFGKTFIGLSLAIFALCLVNDARAQQARSPWKSGEPVTIVVPFAAGGTVDAIARALGHSITSIYGNPVIVENLSGADGLIGTRRVMNAKPDGYTLLMHTSSIVVMRQLPSLKDKPDPLGHLVPLSEIVESPILIVGRASMPAQNFKEFVEYCRTSPKPCSAGSGEMFGRLRASQIAAEANIPNMVNVPYRGTTPAVSDLLNGSIEIAFLALPSAIPHHKAGNVRILAVQDTKRVASLPDVPTTTEAGFPKFQMVAWWGLFAPENTPQPMLNAIYEALAALRGKQTELDKAVDTAGATLVLNSPNDFARHVESDSKTWNDLAERYPLK